MLLCFVFLSIFIIIGLNNPKALPHNRAFDERLSWQQVSLLRKHLYHISGLHFDDQDHSGPDLTGTLGISGEGEISLTDAFDLSMSLTLLLSGFLRLLRNRTQMESLERQTEARARLIDPERYPPFR